MRPCEERGPTEVWSPGAKLGVNVGDGLTALTHYFGDLNNPRSVVSAVTADPGALDSYGLLHVIMAISSIGVIDRLVNGLASTNLTSTLP